MKKYLSDWGLLVEMEMKEKETRQTMCRPNEIVVEKCKNCLAPKELYGQDRLVDGNPELIFHELRPRCSVTKRFLDKPFWESKEVADVLLAYLDKEIDANKAKENEASTVWDRGFYNGCATEAIQLRVKIREILEKIS